MKIHMYMSLDEFANLKEGDVCIGYSKGVLQSRHSIHVEVPIEKIEKIEQLEHGLLYTVNPALSVIYCEG